MLISGDGRFVWCRSFGWLGVLRGLVFQFWVLFGSLFCSAPELFLVLVSRVFGCLLCLLGPVFGVLFLGLLVLSLLFVCVCSVISSY